MIKYVNGKPVDMTADEIAAKQASDDAYVIVAVKNDIKKQILALESTTTQRRLREAILTDGGKKWLTDIDTQIQTLRGQLV